MTDAVTTGAILDAGTGTVIETGASTINASQVEFTPAGFVTDTDAQAAAALDRGWLGARHSAPSGSARSLRVAPAQNREPPMLRTCP